MHLVKEVQMFEAAVAANLTSGPIILQFCTKIKKDHGDPEDANALWTLDFAHVQCVSLCANIVLYSV